MAPDYIKAIEWLASELRTPAGIAEISSQQANWHENAEDHTHHDIRRIPALRVTAHRVAGHEHPHPFFMHDIDDSNPYLANFECEGRFSDGATPAQMRDIFFYGVDSNTGRGTELKVHFEKGDDSIDRIGDHWVMNWKCTGSFKIRRDVTVAFRAGYEIDDSGHVRLESPEVTPSHNKSDHDRSVTIEGNVGVPWNWSATFGESNGVPELRLDFVPDL